VTGVSGPNAPNHGLGLKAYNERQIFLQRKKSFLQGKKSFLAEKKSFFEGKILVLAKVRELPRS
jgi:hypothetical protein